MEYIENIKNIEDIKNGENEEKIGDINILTSLNKQLTASSLFKMDFNDIKTDELINATNSLKDQMIGKSNLDIGSKNMFADILSLIGDEFAKMDNQQNTINNEDPFSSIMNIAMNVANKITKNNSDLNEILRQNETNNINNINNNADNDADNNDNNDNNDNDNDTIQQRKSLLLEDDEFSIQI